MDEAAIETLMERVFKKQLAEASVATKQDVEEIKGTLDEHAAKIAAMETRVQHSEAKASARTPSQWRSAIPAPGRRSTGSTRSTTAASDDNDWEPQLAAGVRRLRRVHAALRDQPLPQLLRRPRQHLRQLQEY